MFVCAVRMMHDEVSDTENIRKNLAIERMIVEGCDILLDTSQTFVRQGELPPQHLSLHYFTPSLPTHSWLCLHGQALSSSCRPAVSGACSVRSAWAPSHWGRKGSDSVFCLPNTSSSVPEHLEESFTCSRSASPVHGCLYKYSGINNHPDKFFNFYQCKLTNSHNTRTSMKGQKKDVLVAVRDNNVSMLLSVELLDSMHSPFNINGI